MKTCSELEIACLLSAMIGLRTVSLFAVGELGVTSVPQTLPLDLTGGLTWWNGIRTAHTKAERCYDASV